MYMDVPQKGIVSFIRMKISSGVTPEEAKHTLLRAGFLEEHVDLAFRFVKEKYPEILQDIVASNDYLPEIHKPGVKVVTRKEAKTVGVIPKTIQKKDTWSFSIHAGLFQGRLRRKDFTLGFLFFFAVGYVVLALSAVVISLVSPDVWAMVLSIIESDKNGSLLLTVPVILLPITIMMLSLITRRLHNLELPGTLSLLFLVLFVPIDIRLFYGMWFVYIALGVLFVLLLAKKGHPDTNQYGPLPESKGSFFRRIFNV